MSFRLLLQLKRLPFGPLLPKLSRCTATRMVFKASARCFLAQMCLGVSRFAFNWPQPGWGVELGSRAGKY